MAEYRSSVTSGCSGTRANHAVFDLNAAGQLQVMPHVSTPVNQVHLIVDVNGYSE